MADTETFKIYTSTSRTAVSTIGCLVLNYSTWPEPIYVTTNPGGCTTPDGLVWLYVPMAISPPSTADDLSYEIPVTLQDMNEDGESNGLNATVNDMVDLIDLDATEAVSATFKEYIQYDNGQIAGPMRQAENMEVTGIKFVDEGCTFTCKPKQTDLIACGRRSSLPDYPQAVQFT